MPDKSKSDTPEKLSESTLAEILEEAKRIRAQSEALNKRMAELSERIAGIAQQEDTKRQRDRKKYSN